MTVPPVAVPYKPVSVTDVIPATVKVPDEVNVQTVYKPTGNDVPPDAVTVKPVASLVRYLMTTMPEPPLAPRTPEVN
jgi:hypothetical protein